MLKDCTCIDIPKFSQTYFNGRNKSSQQKATLWLTKLSQKKFIDKEIYWFTEKDFEDEPIVYTDPHGKWWTGRYIGRIYFEGISVEIKPRFGFEFVVNSIPLNNLLPAEVLSKIGDGNKFIRFIQAMLWLNMLLKSARYSLPLIKQDQTYCSSVIRGRLDVRATIKNLVKDRSKLSSVSQAKIISEPIAITIALAFAKISKWFPEINIINKLPITIAARLQQIISIAPRFSQLPNQQDIKKIRLGTLANSYKQLAILSLDIINNKGIVEHTGNKKNQTFLLDVAELWEFYILDVLRESLTNNIKVEHTSDTQKNVYLLHSKTSRRQLGKLLPDYKFLEKDRTISIGDAKYKRLGDEPWLSPKRDDIYQMAAYLSKYSLCQQASFYYPEWSEDEAANSCDISSCNPWILESKQAINFILVPPQKDRAVKLLGELNKALSRTPIDA